METMCTFSSSWRLTALPRTIILETCSKPVSSLLRQHRSSRLNLRTHLMYRLSNAPVRLIVEGPSVMLMVQRLEEFHDVVVSFGEQVTLFSGFIDVESYDPEKVKLEGYSLSDGTYVSRIERRLD